jgi:hypothetical protein
MENAFIRSSGSTKGGQSRHMSRRGLVHRAERKMGIMGFGFIGHGPALLWRPSQGAEARRVIVSLAKDPILCITPHPGMLLDHAVEDYHIIYPSIFATVEHPLRKDTGAHKSIWPSIVTSRSGLCLPGFRGEQSPLRQGPTLCLRCHHGHPFHSAISSHGSCCISSFERHQEGLLQQTTLFRCPRCGGKSHRPIPRFGGIDRSGQVAYPDEHYVQPEQR